MFEIKKIMARIRFTPEALVFGRSNAQLKMWLRSPHPQFWGLRRIAYAELQRRRKKSL